MEEVVYIEVLLQSSTAILCTVIGASGLPVHLIFKKKARKEVQPLCKQ